MSSNSTPLRFPPFLSIPYLGPNGHSAVANGNPLPPNFQPLPHRDERTTISDESSEDDASSFEADSDDGLDILRPSLHALGLSKYYVPSWSCQDAFREFYQNWKDAIIGSFNLDPRSFTPILKDTRFQIQITIHRNHTSGTGRVSQELLGFIRFNKKAGTLELTNFKAELGLEHLSLGGTTKRGQDQFAGIHGEGFKLAALVMRRSHHAVRFGSTSYYWNFGFGGQRRTNLYCRLSQAKPATVEKKKEAYAARQAATNFRRGLTSNIWEDVTVKISKARGEDGVKISEEDFRSWLNVSIDLDPPQSADIVRTDWGDLILDKQFSGRIYLKGLRVAGHGAGGKVYNFGYNFVQGRINRDRERLTNPSEEALMLARIWEKAIIKKGDDITDEYIKLFRDQEDCADISLANERVSSLTVKTIWSRLRTLSPGVFFYFREKTSESDRVDEANVIAMDLKKLPAPLPEVLWKLLRKFSLVRTPHEERVHLFANSEGIEIDEDRFCVSVVRALKAALSLDRRMKDIKVRFVRGGETGIDLLFEKKKHLLRIHEKWIDFQSIHEVTSCEIFRFTRERLGQVEAFSCDHVVEDLFELALHEIQGPLGLDPAECVVIRQAARERIRQMPRLVEVSTTDLDNELEVSWIGNESGIVSLKYSANIRYHVTLHKVSTCGLKEDELLHRVDTGIANTASGSSSSSTEDATTSCPCIHQTVSRRGSKAIFSGLDPREEYLPMVARDENLAFFGVPPAPVAPKAISAEVQISGNSDYDIGILTDGTDHEEEDERVTASPRASDIPTIVDDPVQRSHASSSSKRQIPRDHYTDDPSTSSPDKEIWKVWYEQELPAAFSRLIPGRGMGCLQNMSAVASLQCQHLNYAFEKDEYARIRTNSELPLDYIIFVHDIRYADDVSDAKSYYLLVTKYSFLSLTYPFQALQSPGDREVAVSDRELLLHFKDFNNMGKRDDAEVIPLDDIGSAEDLISNFENSSDSVEHVVHPLPGGIILESQSWDTVDSLVDVENRRLFCRFGICNATSSAAACITPINSSLLQRQDRWRGRKFIDPPGPIVFDLTPNVLGPSEGFSQAGYSIHAGIGFSPEHHLTWKIRHPPKQVYDGSPQDVLVDFESGKLPDPSLPYPQIPKIALVAGEHSHFSLNDRSNHSPSMEQFLTPLDIIDAASKSALSPDFVAMLMSPALLHYSTIGRFATTIFKFLEQRVAVHIKLSPLEDHGIPQNRSVLIVVTTPSCISLPWNSDWPVRRLQPSVSVKDLIGDLAFMNPRTTQRANSGFMCSDPTQDNLNPDKANKSTKYIYNHCTGRLPQSGGNLIHMDSNAIFMSHNGPEAWVHPTRRDLLTVREIARLQGFADDFVFYHSEVSQMMDICRALPPIVAKRVAKTILHVIQSSLVMRLDDPREALRASKRPRVEKEEGGA